MSRGHVEPGGPALVEQIGPGLTLSKLSVGPMDNNAYLLASADGDAVVVDAAAEPERLIELIGEHIVSVIVTTHRHHDHIGALADLADHTGARVVAGAPDAAAVAAATQLEVESVWTGDEIRVGGSSWQVTGIVGHTPGAIVLAHTPVDGRPTQLLTGDSLFPGGPGKTWSAEDFGTLIDELETKIFGVHADDTVLRPGHGDDSSIGTERPHLNSWRARGW